MGTNRWPLIRLRGSLLFAFCGEVGAGNAISPAQALRYFQEADAIVQADDGQLWGVSLGEGLLLVDPETRLAYASQSDPQDRLTPLQQVWHGTIPTDVNLANTALDWAGAKWSMALLPLPQERAERATLILHELWHHVQEELGLPEATTANVHLDTRAGRYWLQLEWRALAAALGSNGQEGAEAVTDAALFRAHRRALFPNAALEENAMEMHEGLEQYTGVKLCGAPDPARFVIESDLRRAPKKETFGRSFAYATGPAYGLLLDASGVNWRKDLRPTSDLAGILLGAVNRELPANAAAEAEDRAARYDGASQAAQEEKRENARREGTKRYRQRLVDDRTLTLPLRNMKMEFDPGILVPLDSLGTVYPRIRIVDDWGVLEATDDGVLVSADFSQAKVSVPTKVTADTLIGEGWRLDLKPGWSLIPGKRETGGALQQSPVQP